MSPYVDAIFTLEVNDPAFMAMVATTMPSGVQLYIDSNFCTHSCGPRRVVHRRVVHPCDTGGAAKTLDETSTCVDGRSMLLKTATHVVRKRP